MPQLVSQVSCLSDRCAALGPDLHYFEGSRTMKTSLTKMHCMKTRSFMRCHELDRIVTMRDRAMKLPKACVQAKSPATPRRLQICTCNVFNMLYSASATIFGYFPKLPNIIV